MLLEKNKPILGICRGMQLINCKLKGNLINDLETVRNVNHKKFNNGADREHHVIVNKNTLLSQIIEKSEGEVNSSHHQAIDRLGEGLMVSSKSPDGIIEGIELSDKTNSSFFLGIQWHPERMINKDSPFVKNIINRFKKETEK